MTEPGENVRPFIVGLAAAASYFACVFGAGFVLGMIRVPLIVPRLGVRIAELIEMPFMVVIVVVSAKFVVRRFHLPRSRPYRLLVGCFALALVVAAELAVTVLLAHQSIGEYIASRDPISGSAYLGVLILFTLMPAMGHE